MKHINDEKLTQIATIAQVDTDTVEDWLYNDWDNGDEHEDWILTAPASEIADWITSNIAAGA